MREGWIEEILLGDIAAEPPGPVGRARVVPRKGLEGDRYFTGVGTWADYSVQTGKDLTLIEAEVLDAVLLTGADARRNLVTREIRLAELVGRHFRIGQVDCYGHRLCEPCTQLEQLTGLPVQALKGRGGLRAEILTEGEIHVGDPIVPT
jgi:MOSC domain-containing protein YiiM